MYQIYKAHFTRFGKPALVIVTALKNAGGYWKAESFVIFPDPHEGKKFMELRFDARSFSSSPIDLNEEFMLHEAMGQARIDLGVHIHEKYSDHPFLLASSELEFEEAGINHLAHLRVRETADYLVDIRDYTQCDELAEALHSVLALPPIMRREL